MDQHIWKRDDHFFNQFGSWVLSMYSKRFNWTGKKNLKFTRLQVFLFSIYYNTNW